MSFKDAVEACREHIWEPDNLTDQVWYRRFGEIRWGDTLEEIEDGNGYSSDRFREVYYCGDYVIGKIDDGCGGWYQAIFSKAMEIEYE